MADGDVVLDRNVEVDAEEATRVHLFVVEDASYPGGYYYRFQYYAPVEGETILRYDNAHDADVGHHHRHEGEEVTGIDFDGLRAHVPASGRRCSTSMPDADHDGPAPEDVNFPETLRITLASGEEALDRAVEAAGAAEAGEHRDAVVSFENAEGIRRLLTDRRLELLRSLMGEPAGSITALADRLDRSYSVVHDDVEVLAEYGVVQFRREGQSKQPFVPYQRIEFDVTVEAPVTGEDVEAIR